MVVVTSFERDFVAFSPTDKRRHVTTRTSHQRAVKESSHGRSLSPASPVIKRTISNTKKNAHGNNKHSTINLFHSFIYRWLPIQFSNYTFSTIYFFYFGFGVLFHNGAKKYFSGTVGRPCAKSLAADGCDVNYDPAQRCCGY